MDTPRKEPRDDAPVGRPRKIGVDAGIAKAICDNLERGRPVGHAAESEGVGRTTLYRWIENFPRFSEQVMGARAEPFFLHRKVFEGGHGSWWEARLLARLFPEDYGIRSREAEPTEVKITTVSGLPKHAR